MDYKVLACLGGLFLLTIACLGGVAFVWVIIESGSMVCIGGIIIIFIVLVIIAALVIINHFKVGQAS